jgi:hypothetical protein
MRAPLRGTPAVPVSHLSAFVYSGLTATVTATQADYCSHRSSIVAQR